MSIFVGMIVLMCMLFDVSDVVYFCVSDSCVFFVVVYLFVLFCFVSVVFDEILMMVFWFVFRCGIYRCVMM